MRRVELVSYAPGNIDLWIGSFHAMWSRDIHGHRFFAIAFGDQPRRRLRIPSHKGQ